MNKLFSFEGRARRSEFLFHSIIDDIIMIAFIGIAVALSATLGKSATFAIVILVLLTAVVLIVGSISEIAVTVRRLHDLDRPGTHFWLTMIPFMNIYLAIILLFKQGTEGPNRYGNDPKALKIKTPPPPGTSHIVRTMSETVREIP